MSIPENISKSHIESAINEIKNSNIPSERLSYKYYLVENDVKLPPKYVICVANKYANNHELKGNEFNAVQAKSYLKKMGFNIIEKNKDLVNVWFVCQGSTFTNERGKKFLWAPKLDKKGNPKFYWENMKNVKKGDIIFNYSKGIRGVSVAKNDCYDSENADHDSVWGKEGYRVDIDLFEFDRVIKIVELKRNKENIELVLDDIEKKPFNVNGDVNQGYLYEFTPEAGKIIFDIYGKSVGNEIIDKYFNNLNRPEIPPRSHGNKSNFNCSEFNRTLINSGLLFSPQLTTRFISSLLTKPFVILTGLSGSGKTKMAQAFSKWICQDENQYCIVPVGADWTNREPLLGFPNALKDKEYVKPDNRVLDLIIEANKNSNKPYFLILDEMNLSHVERYFADFLSVMETGKEIPLHSEFVDWKDDVPSKIKLPKNLFIVGTVNIDETTYMFSPKVLDRANVIEFRVTENNMEEYLKNIKPLDLESINGLGANMAWSFVELANNGKLILSNIEDLNSALNDFFRELKKTGAEFGYRSASEIHRFVAVANHLDPKWNMTDIIDGAIMQKLLPKVHGSRKKLDPVLKILGTLCLQEGQKFEDLLTSKTEIDFNNNAKIKYPVSLEKILRMYHNLISNGFTSYAEA